jgi:hypothetical protein
MKIPFLGPSGRSSKSIPYRGILVRILPFLNRQTIALQESRLIKVFYVSRCAIGNFVIDAMVLVPGEIAARIACLDAEVIKGGVSGYGLGCEPYRG